MQIMAANLPTMHRRRLILGTHLSRAASLPRPGHRVCTHAPGHRRGFAGMAGLAASALSKRACRSPCWRPATASAGATGRCAPETPCRPGGTSPALQPSSPGQYLNAGAWRIPPWHHRVLQRSSTALHWNPFGKRWLPLLQGAMQPAGGMDAPMPWRRHCKRRAHPHCGAARRAHGHSRPRGRGCLGTPPRGVERLQSDLTPCWPCHWAQWHARSPPATRPAPGSAGGADRRCHQDRTETDGTWAQGVPTDAQPLVLPPAAGYQSYSVACVYGNAPSIAQSFSGPRTAQIAQAQARCAPARQAAQAWRHPLVVQWSRMPWACGARSAPAARCGTHLAALQWGLPHFWASDALTPLNGWQEGALASAEQAAQALLCHARHERPRRKARIRPRT